eukprot:gene11570-17820_t
MASITLKEGQVDANCIDYRQNVHPTGVCPALETDFGYIAGGAAVLKYLGERGPRELVGRTTFERAAIDSFIVFSASEVGTALASQDSGSINGMLTNMDKWLETRTFLASERLSIADLVVFAALVPFYETVMTTAVRKQFTDLNRWFDTVANNSHMKLGPITFSSKAPAWYKADAKPAVAVTTAPAKPAEQQKEGKKEGKKEKDGKKKDDKEAPAWKKDAEAKKKNAGGGELDGSAFDLRIGLVKD